MNKQKRVIYYSDELREEFSTAQITPKVIDGTYQYDDSSTGRKAAHILCYRILARPLAALFLKIRFAHKIVNRKVLKEAAGGGFFLFGNHTNAAADALIPSMVAYPADTYVIVHPNNVSMPFFGRVTPYLGALPLPDDMQAAKNFLRIIEQKSEKCCIMIYPEAHIWPYYTKIRPFTDASFRYPVQFGTPVFCFTNTYQKRRFGKRPGIVTYVDGPFYPDPALDRKEQKKALRNQVYRTMAERSRMNTVEWIHYEKKPDECDGIG